MKARAIVFSLLVAGCTGASKDPSIDSVSGAGSPAMQPVLGERIWRFSLGPEICAARIRADGVLVALEQRRTGGQVAHVTPNVSSSSDVREFLGRPYRMDSFPRLKREIWTYKVSGGPWPKELLVQFSSDSIVRELLIVDDDEERAG